MSINWENAKELLDERKRLYGTGIGGKLSDIAATLIYRFLGQRKAYGLALRISEKGRKYNPSEMGNVV